MLEQKSHPFSTFLTLTIADDDSKDFEPNMRTKHDEKWQLNKRQLQKFIKRLRRYSGRHFRYYAVGEYGEHTDREHYHLALFNYPFWDTEPIQRAWKFGNFQSDELNSARAYYLAGYVTKKLTTIGSVSGGRNPEFAIMSRGNQKGGASGIGVPYLKTIASTMLKANTKLSDTNGCIRINTRPLPLDRYIKIQLAKMLKEEELPEFQKWLKLDMHEDFKRKNFITEFKEREISEHRAKRIMRRKKGTL